MQYHEIISKIRINKNIKVADLLNDNMSRSSYNRYVSGKTDIYSYHFLGLLDQLHISTSELSVIANNYNPSKLDTFLQNTRSALKNKNYEELYSLYHHAIPLAKKNQNDFYTHISEIIYLALKTSNYQISCNVTCTHVYRYLLKSFIWTTYEFNLFNLILPFLTESEVKPFLPKIEYSLSKEGYSKYYMKQYFNLICDIIFYFIQHQNYVNASHYLTLLENYDLTENLVYEKLLLTFFTNLKKLLLHQPANTWRRPLTKCIATAKFLDMPNLAEKFEQTILQITN